MRQDDQQIFAFILNSWNIFAESNGYKKLKKLNDKQRRKIKTRTRCEPDYLSRFQGEWTLIHNLSPKNEYGMEADLYHFLRASILLKAIYKAERENG